MLCAKFGWNRPRTAGQWFWRRRQIHEKFTTTLTTTTTDRTNCDQKAHLNLRLRWAIFLIQRKLFKVKSLSELLCRPGFLYLKLYYHFVICIPLLLTVFSLYLPELFCLSLYFSGITRIYLNFCYYLYFSILTCKCFSGITCIYLSRSYLYFSVFWELYTKVKPTQAAWWHPPQLVADFL